MSRLTKTQVAKLNAVLARLYKRPASVNDAGKKAVASYDLWLDTWVAPYLEEIVRASGHVPTTRPPSN